MRSVSRWVLGAGLALLLGCQGTLPPPAAPARAARTPAKAGPVQGLPLPEAATTGDLGTTLAPGQGAGLVANNGATLFGTLRAPASLVSDQGGALVSDQGGAIVANQGAYRLTQTATVAQVALRDALVELRDAAGNPVLDEAGTPITARTDASGAFAFQALLPDRNLIVTAPLAGGRGAILAVATKDARTAALDADLFSTLTTAYIVSKFVASQADRQQTLDRLPGEVAQETRLLAESAFTRTQAQVPATLDETSVVASAESLRQGVDAFDQQMEKVRRLLIAAGLSNLGEGRPATTVSFESFDGLAEGPDGSVYFLEKKLWRVRPDGILVTAIGGGTLEAAAADGQKADALSLEGLQGWGFDPTDRLVVMVDRHMLRLEADGTLRLQGVVPEGPRKPTERPRWWRGGLLAARAQDYLLQLSYTWDREASLWRWQPGQEPLQVATLQVPEGLHMGGFTYVPGRGVLTTFWGHGLPSEYLWIDPDTGATETWRPPLPGAAQPHVDGRGNVLYTTGEPENRLRVWPLGGSTPLAFDTWSGFIGGGLLSRDGKSALLQEGGRIVRVTASGVTPVAGLTGASGVGGNARDLALFEPVTMTVANDGEMWLTDRRRGQLLRVDAADQVHEVTLADPSFRNGQLYALKFPNMRPGPDGTVQMLARLKDQQGVHQVRKDGTSTLLYTPPAGYGIETFAPREAGALVVLLTAYDKPHRLLERAADGTERVLFEASLVPHDLPSGTQYHTHEPDLRNCDLAPAPGGAVWLYGKGRIARWRNGSGLETLRRGEHLHRPEEQNEGFTRGALALGPDGALYFTPGDPGNGSWNEVRRWDPVTGQESHVAGPRGLVFTGSAVDDRLDDPHSPAFSPSGELLFIDAGSKQVRRIPKDKLAGNPVSAAGTDGPADGGDE
ncbi:MAG: hypothetical protein VKS61_00595 [Candidatus Sericytochromatia bacterium]|nr:hypothetical protein [Candidatus Sericytochromatia bacterium]